MESTPLIDKVLSMDKRKSFIYSLVEYDGIEPFFITDLERHYGWETPQQDIRKVVASLIEMGIIVEFEKIKGDYNFKLKAKLLKKMIRESELFIRNGRFIELTKLIQYY